MWTHHRRTENLRLEFPSPSLCQAGAGHSYIRLPVASSSPDVELIKAGDYTAHIPVLYQSYCEDFFLLDLIRISHVETCHHYTRPLLCMKDLPRNLSLSTKDLPRKRRRRNMRETPIHRLCPFRSCL